MGLNGVEAERLARLAGCASAKRLRLCRRPRGAKPRAWAWGWCAPAGPGAWP